MLKNYLDNQIIPSFYLSEIRIWLLLFLDKQEVIPNYSYKGFDGGFFLLVVMSTSVSNIYLKSSLMENAVKPIQKKYLFYTLLPASLYKISYLSCLGIMMDDLLFNDQGIYVIQTLKGQGVLNGKVEDWYLKLIPSSLSIEKTIRDLLPIFESKGSLFKELLQLYETNLIVEGYICL